MNQRLKSFKNTIIIITGSVLYALSVSVFTAPNNIAPGGLTGIGTVLNYLFKIPIGTFILIMNVPLFIIGFKILGRGYLLKSALGTACASAAIDLISPFVIPYRGDMILTCLFGGALSGTGLALIFSRGGSTGGTDIIASIVHKRLSHISIGRLILVFDAAVVTLSAFAYGNAENAMYAAVAIFVSSKVIDVVSYGTSRDNGKLMFIITTEHREILSQLLTKVSRGVTVLDAFGGYSGEKRKILMCALRPNQLFKADSIVKSLDKNAFLIVTTASTVSGLGFKNKT